MSQLIEQPPISLIPESAPFTAEQRAWLNGFFAGWMGLTGDVPSAATEARVADSPGSAGEEEAFPWHDAALPLAERLELAKERPLPRRLMAAMAQLDCGACGYVCKTYAEKLASGEEACLTLCSPGGRETSRALKVLLKEGVSGAQPSETVPRLPAKSGPSDEGGGRVAAAGSGASPKWSRQYPYHATVVKAVNLNGPGSDKQTPSESPTS